MDSAAPAAIYPTKAVQPASARQGAIALSALLATLLLTWLPQWAVPGFYFRDDMQHQYVPAMIEIGRMLRTAEFPFISERSWHGGNFIGEYQYGILNPVSLALSAWLPSIEDLSLASVTIVSVYQLILAGGVLVLAHGYALRPAVGALAALTMAASPFVQYWFASSWLPGLASLAFMPWAMAAFRAARQRRAFVLPLVGAIYLVGSAGWPHALLALSIALGALWLFDTEGRARVRLLLACAAGYALSAIALLPLLAWRAASDRPSAIFNAGTFNVSPTAFASIGFPSGQLRIESFFAADFTGAPFFFVALWMLPLLACFSPTLMRADAARDRRALLVLAVVFALLSLGPSQLGPLRWSFRWYPYFALVLVLLGALALDRGWWKIERGTLKRLLLLVLVCLVLFTQQRPEAFVAHLVSVVLVLGGAAALYLVRARGTSTIAGVAAVLVALPIVPMALEFPRNLNTADWAVPQRSAEYVWPQGVGADDRVLTLRAGPPIPPTPESMLPVLHSGNTSLAGALYSINGYSPLDPRGLRRMLCWDLFSWSCVEALRALDVPDPLTGQSLQSLFGVSRIIVDARLEAQLGGSAVPGWMTRSPPCFSHAQARIWCFERPADDVAWVTPGWRARAVARPRSARYLRVELEPQSSAAQRGEGLLVLSRAWYPGFEAKLGERRLPVVAHRDVFLAVRLPPDAAGTVRLRWRYPFRQWVAPLIIVALLATIAASIWRAARDRAAAPAREPSDHG